MNVGIIGLGAIGGPLAARLLRTRPVGETIALAAGSERNVISLRETGLRVEEGGQKTATPAPGGKLLGGVLPVLDAPYDLILLCTRTDAIEAALASAAQLLGPAGALVCVQNGLPEARAAAVVGADRTLGTVIGWSSSSDGPGSYQVTSAGRLTLGSFSPAGAKNVPAALALLQRAAPTKVTGNLAGSRWSKLALNCAMSTIGTVAGLNLGGLAARADARLLAMRVVGEVVQVGLAHGVRFERVAGVDPAWLGEASAGGARNALARPLRHALLWAACQPHRKQRSGMLARLEQGRPAGQIDDLNGAVVEAGKKVGRGAPVNARLVEIVHAIERGEQKIGVHQIGSALGPDGN